MFLVQEGDGRENVFHQFSFFYGHLSDYQCNLPCGEMHFSILLHLLHLAFT